MVRMVTAHPDYALAHAFMAVWHAFEIVGGDNPYQGLDTLNTCLAELENAATLDTENPHDEVLILYIRGRILTAVGISGDHLARGIQAFETLLDRREELTAFYAARMPFFPRWLWPNVYWFLGEAYRTAGMFRKALAMFDQGRRCRMLDPYQARIQEGIEAAQFKLEQKGEQP